MFINDLMFVLIKLLCPLGQEIHSIPHFFKVHESLDSIIFSLQSQSALCSAFHLFLYYFQCSIIFLQVQSKRFITMSSETKERPVPKKSLSNKITDAVGNTFVSGLESISSMSLGQGILKMFDRTLWVIEKSTQWSLPVPEPAKDDNGKIFGPMELVRPLPWVFFIPTLIILRVSRVVVNIGAFMLGQPQIEPSHMISNVQKIRKRLRLIKLHGVRVMREKMSERAEKEEVVRKARMNIFQSIQCTLSTLFCLGGNKKCLSSPPTRILVGSLQEIESVDSDTAEKKVKTDHKRKHEESDDNEIEEHLMEKIDRMAGEDSGNDEDYIPEEEQSKSSSSTDTSYSNSEQEDLEISQSEINEIVNDQVEVLETIENRDESSIRGHCSTEKYDFDDGEMKFYSPISSTSDSSERSSTSVRCAIDFGIRSGDKIESGENGNGKIVARIDSEKGLCSDDGTNDNVKNGRNEEKRHGKSSKSHHKNKRNSCANRKKK